MKHPNDESRQIALHAAYHMNMNELRKLCGQFNVRREKASKFYLLSAHDAISSKIRYVRELRQMLKDFGFSEKEINNPKLFIALSDTELLDKGWDGPDVLDDDPDADKDFN